MNDKIESNVYMFFGRNCAEAMEFYKGIFGGELVTTTRGSVDPTAPEDMKELLIHADLSGGLVHLMGADNTDATDKPQDRLSISLSGNDEAKMRELYAALAEDGEATHPMKKEFWGDTFGGLTDKFGITWLVNAVAAKAQEAAA